MAKYRKKPIEVEAFRVGYEPWKKLSKWCNGGIIRDGHAYHSIIISTPEDRIRADKGDWIIKGIKGEFYPCKPDIFEATYELV